MGFFWVNEVNSSGANEDVISSIDTNTKGRKEGEVKEKRGDDIRVREGIPDSVLSADAREKIPYIVLLRAKGYTYREIADALKISATLISNTLKRWRNGDLDTLLEEKGFDYLTYLNYIRRKKEIVESKDDIELMERKRRRARRSSEVAPAASSTSGIGNVTATAKPLATAPSPSGNDGVITIPMPMIAVSRESITRLAMFAFQSGFVDVNRFIDARVLPLLRVIQEIEMDLGVRIPPSHLKKLIQLGMDALVREG